MATRPAPGTGKWWAVGIVGIGLAVGLVIWVGLRQAGERITATTVSFKVVDDTSVWIAFDVSRPPQLPVTCTLRAMDGHFSVVGSAAVVLPPATNRTTHHVETVRTATRAVTGVVQDCVRS